MKTIKAGNKEYKIQYGYLATVKSKIIKDLAGLDAGGNELDMLDTVLGILPKLLLVGLQKFHKDEYGCDFSDVESTGRAIEKTGELLDEYFDSSDSDIQGLFMILQDELVANGFLSKSMRRNQQETAPQENAPQENQQNQSES